MTAHSNELNSDRLRRLSGEVSRVASALARLSIDPEIGSADLADFEKDTAPEVAVDTVVAVIRARRLRGRYFDEQLFADPAWDMMLDLLEAELTGQRVAVSNLSNAAAVPATTALRWIKTMVDRGLFVRHNDPLDGRRVFVELAPGTSRSLRRYFAHIGNTPAI